MYSPAQPAASAAQVDVQADPQAGDQTPAGPARSGLASSTTVLDALAIPFSVLRSMHRLNFDGDVSVPRMVPVSSRLLGMLFEAIAERIRVDEEWYCAHYPDIGEAIVAGKFESARHHYLKFGYLENRLPHYIAVDEAFYRAANKDIAEKLRLGHLQSAQQHFEQFGFREGRIPFKGWRLF
jgi:hypothetical protein